MSEPVPGPRIHVHTTMHLEGHEDVEGPPREMSRGDALISFIDQIVHDPCNPARVAIILFAQVTLELPLGPGVRGKCLLTYHASSDDAAAIFRPFLLALWFYTRHPTPRRLLSEVLDDKLRELCLEGKWDSAVRATRHPHDPDPARHRRYALLFAASVSDRAEIERAMQLDDVVFNNVISLWLDDDPPTWNFPELLDFAEGNAPADAAP